MSRVQHFQRLPPCVRTTLGHAPYSLDGEHWTNGQARVLALFLPKLHGSTGQVIEPLGALISSSENVRNTHRGTPCVAMNVREDLQKFF